MLQIFGRNKSLVNKSGSCHMKPVAVISGHFKQCYQYTFTHILHRRNNCWHGAAVQPELHWAQDQTLPHYLIKLGLVMEETEVGDGQLNPCCGQ